MYSASAIASANGQYYYRAKLPDWDAENSSFISVEMLVSSGKALPITPTGMSCPLNPLECQSSMLFDAADHQDIVAQETGQLRSRC